MSRASPIRRTCLALIALLAVMGSSLSVHDLDFLPVHYFREQDLPALAFIVVGLVACVYLQPRTALPGVGPNRIQMIVIAVVLALALWGATYWLMCDYPLTRDEHMVVFDLGIFRRGQLAQPLAPFWREYTLALVPAFLLDVPSNTLLASGYMPGNALLRTGFSFIADPALMNPLLTAIGLLALYDIATRLFEGDRKAVTLVLAGYLLSAQILVNAMTDYAMTGHLALNLVWLMLFLRGKWWQHALAIAVGFWTTGLHQVVFHPLFAGPFILTLISQKRYRLFAIYSTAYAAALVFWISYPSMVTSSLGVASDTGPTGGPLDFLRDRLIPLLTMRDPGALAFMEFNLVRMVTWMPLFVLPFGAFAWRRVREGDPIVIALFAGIVFTLVVMTILMANQGHGWGYRYLHGLMGNFMLLAGYGYRLARQNEPRLADGAYALLAALTAFGTLPFMLWSAHTFIKPYVALDKIIAQQKTDFVIIDTEEPSSAVDQVRNVADLSSHPIRLASRAMTARQIQKICRRGTVTLITRSDFHRAAFAPQLPAASPVFERKTAILVGQPCLRPAI